VTHGPGAGLNSLLVRDGLAERTLDDPADGGDRRQVGIERAIDPPERIGPAGDGRDQAKGAIKRYRES